MAVAADHSLARLGVAKIRADDMHYALQGAEAVVEGYVKLLAVASKGVQLGLRDLVSHRKRQIPGGGVVICRGHRKVGTANGTASHSKPIERLRRGDLVDEVEVDIDDGRFARLFVDHVGVPNLLEHSLRGHQITPESWIEAKPEGSERPRCAGA